MKGLFRRAFAPGGLTIVALAALIAGCTNSSNNSTPIVTPTPTPTGTTRGTASCNTGASPASTTAPVSQGGLNTITSPTVGGCSFTISVTGFSGTATTATITTQLTAPSGLATPIPGPGQGGPPTGFSLPYTPVFYAVLTFNGTAGITGTPLEVYTVPTLTAGKNFFSVSWTNTGGTSSFNAYGADCNNNALALTVVGNTLTLPACSGSAGGQLPVGSQLVFALAYF